MINKDDLKLIKEKLIRLQEKHAKQLSENEINFFTQYTKGQVDAYEEILSYLKSKLL